MKTLSFLRFKTWGMATALVLAATAFSGCDKDDDDDNRLYTISGNANSAQMVPPGTATGTATLTGTYNPANRLMTYNTTWTGLTGAPTMGGFYNGATGVSGTAVGTPWTFDAGATGTGSSTGTMTLTAEQETQFLDGNWYYSYGTAANSMGEVRGQLSAVR